MYVFTLKRIDNNFKSEEVEAFGTNFLFLWRFQAYPREDLFFLIVPQQQAKSSSTVKSQEETLVFVIHEAFNTILSTLDSD